MKSYECKCGEVEGIGEGHDIERYVCGKCQRMGCWTEVKNINEGCECFCPMLEDGRCRKENASCYMVKEPISQKQTIEKIIGMATPSLDPDSYTALLDIMGRLAATRKIDWKPE